MDGTQTTQPKRHVAVKAANPLKPRTNERPGQVPGKRRARHKRFVVDSFRCVL